LQSKAIAQIKNIIESKFGSDVPLFIGGDFNDDVQHSPDLAAIGRSGMKDFFDLSLQPFQGSRATHTYHGHDGTFSAQQIDALWANNWSARQNLILSAGIYRWRNDFNQEKPLPQTIDERNNNPSDHFPVWGVIDFAKLLKLSRQRTQQPQATYFRSLSERQGQAALAKP
ncbi:MAG: hypothetical protein WCG27_00800, partial [Pseudomonadota bacterium]